MDDQSRPGDGQLDPARLRGAGRTAFRVAHSGGRKNDVATVRGGVSGVHGPDGATPSARMTREHGDAAMKNPGTEEVEGGNDERRNSNDESNPKLKIRMTKLWVCGHLVICGKRRLFFVSSTGRVFLLGFW